MKNDKENRMRRNRIYGLLMIFMAAFGICFVAVMGYLNYRTTAIELQEQVISRIESDAVSDMETALGFGKSFGNYYGTDEIFKSFTDQFPGTEPFIITRGGRLMYSPSWMEDTHIRSFISSGDFTRALPGLVEEGGGGVVAGGLRSRLSAIHDNGTVIGFFGCVYKEKIFDSQFETVKEQAVWLTLILLVATIVALKILLRFLQSESFLKKHGEKQERTREKLGSAVILTTVILLLSAISIIGYQKDYRGKIELATRTSLQNLENTVKKVREQGVDLRDVEGLTEYISDRVSSLETLHTVRIAEHLVEVRRTDEQSDILSFVFGAGEGEELLYLEAEVSKKAMNSQMISIVLTLISTLVILLIFVFELSNIVELVEGGASEKGEFSEKKVSVALRLTGFLCSTAEYMCVPYAAMLIRASGETLFGLSSGLTAALPLTLEGFAQMIGMLVVPRFVKKRDIRVTLVVSTLVMMAANISAFALGGAMVIVICRAIAGFAYAGFKQISNYLITSGYESEEGRSNNISQDNAGLLAGATCGAGLGAILSANMGYSATFMISALIFAAYMGACLIAVPWKAMLKRKKKDEESKPISAAGIKKMIFSPEMLFYVVFFGIPLNIGVMLCVTLIPAICQTRGISSVMLSYCYIANGIAGIYIGPALVAKARKRFGLPLCVAATFLLTAVGIFILHVPPIMLMLVLSSMILGFLDGFGTPMVMDQFMELKVVKDAVDESTALIFSVVLAYILLTFAPMIAELLLLPGKGMLTPMMAGACVYVVAAVVIVLYRVVKGNGGKKHA
ncbi:MAG: MFS transporter [Lachnospiraceae bacterium]|nr:MFS transporter [Lachnospiraceae bacterium]